MSPGVFQLALRFRHKVSPVVGAKHSSLSADSVEFIIFGCFHGIHHFLADSMEFIIFVFENGEFHGFVFLLILIGNLKIWNSPFSF